MLDVDQESPSPYDLMDQRTEGSLISEGLRLAGVPCEYNLAVTYERFIESIHNRMADATFKYQK